MNRQNLDVGCAETGYKIGNADDSERGDGKKKKKEREKLIRQALSIVEEQGVYAMFLFLKREDKKGKGVYEDLLELLRDTGLIAKEEHSVLLRKLGSNLDRLILARDLLRQALIYGLEHARLAASKEQRS